VQFCNIINQQKTKQQLLQSVADERIPHTLLFLGIEGSGVLPMAIAFITYLLCENKTADDCCGLCSPCLKMKKLIHPDVHFSFPVISWKDGKSFSKPKSDDFILQWRKSFTENPYLNVVDWIENLDGENRQGNITVEECHDILRKISLKTFEAEYKVVLIWMPEFLKEAANVLLKSLEEPPANTLFILVAENQEMILKTVISRTQLVKLQPLQDNDISSALQLQFQLGETAATKIARSAEGNFNEAIKLIRQEENNNERLFVQWMKLCLNQNTPQLVGWIDEVKESGIENQKALLRYGLELFREIFLWKQLGEASLRIHENEKAIAKWFQENVSEQLIEKIAERMDESIGQLERNANARILFMHLSLQLSSWINRNELHLNQY